jgi:TetR/AcrR family transcriptional regulator, transcriptional repressor for nem operon
MQTQAAGSQIPAVIPTAEARTHMQKGEKTRQRIIETAAVLFNKTGFEGSSMKAVGDAVGLEKGSLYTHFRSKEELANEALAFACQSSFLESTEGMDQFQSPTERLKQHLANLAAKPHFPGGCPMMNLATSSSETESELRGRARETFAGWVSFVRNLVEEAQSAGELSRSLDGETFATLAISLLEGSYLASQLQQSKAAQFAARDHLYSYLDSFLLKHSKSSKKPRTSKKR